MKVFRILVYLSVVFAVSFAVISFLPSEPQEEWEAHQLPKLQRFAPDQLDSMPGPMESEPGCLDGNEEFFRFKDGGWVYVIYHPTHSEQSGKTGGMALAIDNDRNIFSSAASFCDGLYEEFKPKYFLKNDSIRRVENTSRMENMEHFLCLSEWHRRN